MGLRLFDLAKPHPPGLLNPPDLFQRSSRTEQGARVSRDGKLVVFRSNREGANALWISGLDGSNLRRLTQTSPQGAFPAWSPDGEMIAFISSPGGPGIKCVFVINSSGGPPRQLTPETEIVGPPHWSGDGRWIYVSLNRNETSQIWKITAAGEHPSQITRNGGFEAQESLDGKFLYYTDKAFPDASGLQAPVQLMRVPVNGGDEVAVLPQVLNFYWSVTDKGIYYLSPKPAPTRSLHLYRFDTGRSDLVGDFPATGNWMGGIGVSRDGRWMFTGRFDRNDTELMLIDHFR